MSTPPRNHNDAPVTTDDFGRQEFIQAVCQEIQHCQPPKGLAINGYWGTGKTSALRLVYARLSGKQLACRKHPDSYVIFLPVFGLSLLNISRRFPRIV